MSRDIRDKFENSFLAGRSRKHTLFASLLVRGADGEYSNMNTRVAFAWFVKGLESAVVSEPVIELPCEWVGLDDRDWKQITDRVKEAAGLVGVKCVVGGEHG